MSWLLVRENEVLRGYEDYDQDDVSSTQESVYHML